MEQKQKNPTLNDYYNSGQGILEEEKEISDRTDDLEDLATGEAKATEGDYEKSKVDCKSKIRRARNGYS